MAQKKCKPWLGGGGLKRDLEAELAAASSDTRVKTKPFSFPNIILKMDLKIYVVDHEVLLQRCWRPTGSGGSHDNGHLIMFVDGAEDDLGSVLGDLQLGVGDGSPVVQDHYYVLWLRPDCRDVDRSRRSRSSLQSVLVSVKGLDLTQLRARQMCRHAGVDVFPPGTQTWRDGQGAGNYTGARKTTPQDNSVSLQTRDW